MYKDFYCLRCDRHLSGEVQSAKHKCCNACALALEKRTASPERMKEDKPASRKVNQYSKAVRDRKAQSDFEHELLVANDFNSWML